jgi:HAD superfamily hydrolase (TIGR01509 family)
MGLSGTHLTNANVFAQTRVVLFDLQQTLINDFEAQFQAHKAILTEHYSGNLQAALDDIVRLWGIRVFDVYQGLFGPTFSDQAIQTLVEKRDHLYLELLRQFPLQACEGAPEALQRLKAHHYPIGVVSGIRRVLLETALQQARLLDSIDFLLGAEDTQHSKPDPEPFLVAAAHFHAPPAQCVMIGDSFVDIRGAKQAGMKAIGVITGFTEKQELLAEGADIVLDTLKTLPHVLMP